MVEFYDVNVKSSVSAYSWADAAGGVMKMIQLLVHQSLETDQFAVLSLP